MSTVLYFVANVLYVQALPLQLLVLATVANVVVLGVRLWWR